MPDGSSQQEMARGEEESDRQLEVEKEADLLRWLGTCLIEPILLDEVNITGLNYRARLI